MIGCRRAADRAAAPIGMKESAAAASADNSLPHERTVRSERDRFAFEIAVEAANHEIRRFVAAAVGDAHQMVNRRPGIFAQCAVLVIKNRVSVFSGAACRRNLGNSAQIRQKYQ